MADSESEDNYRYEAYVCHSNSEKDIKVIRHIVDTLEKSPHHVRLCLPERDMADNNDDDERCKLIQESCKRLMIMLSPDHTKDSIRHVIQLSENVSSSSSSRRIVPVMIEKPCNIPETIEHLVTIDYTREEVRDWFFSRLAASLKH